MIKSQSCTAGLALFFPQRDLKDSCIFIVILQLVCRFAFCFMQKKGQKSPANPRAAFLERT